MKYINGEILKGMILSGANNLLNNKNRIDALNVFPVPDGDTGTNMSMTFSNGLAELTSSTSFDLSSVAKTLSRGLLMGARGNSGVILSQIFRGFYQAIENKKEIDAKDLASAFEEGTRVAYKAVMRPVEGTILTVVREASYYTKKYVDENPDISVLEFFDVLVKEANISLNHTPDLLPVLKEVGVVDSGASGLISIIDGFKAYLEGNPIEVDKDINSDVESKQTELKSEEFGYCTEFILKLNEKTITTFKDSQLRDNLSKIGNSLVVVQDEDLVKVHVHTLTPGDALNIGQRHGEFIKLKIENMQEQHSNIVHQSLAVTNLKNIEKKKYALISVSAGDGLKKIFEEYRVDVVISGGQTMNPSTEDFSAAIKTLNADYIIILPNNSNIILAARQAAEISEGKIHVLETKSIPQGLAACLMFNPEVGIEENLSEMQVAIDHVKTGQVTYAIKDTTYDGLKINENDYMGIYNKDIVVASKDRLTAVKSLLEKMIDEDSEIATIIYGEDIEKSEAEEIAAYVEETYNIETDLQDGKQPVYSYIIGIE